MDVPISRSPKRPVFRLFKKWFRPSFARKRHRIRPSDIRSGGRNPVEPDASACRLIGLAPPFNADNARGVSTLRYGFVGSIRVVPAASWAASQVASASIVG